MSNYDKDLIKQFGNTLRLVRHDTSPTGYPAYIQCQLGKKPKDMGMTAMDYSNFIYRNFVQSFVSTPEYLGRGKTTSIRIFLKWEDIEPMRLNILKYFGKERMIKVEKYLPFEFQSIPLGLE